MSTVKIWRDGALVDVDSNEVEPGDLPTPNPVEPYRVAIQQMIDAVARARSYDSGVTCASYVGSTIPDWAAEAAAFIAWRDGIWAYAYGELAKVQAGHRAQPEVIELLAELPAISWPS